jgi:hypothetical protein
MNIYTRLNAARAGFHMLKLAKTGFNSFSKYNYFELGDFLLPALETLSKHGLCAVVSFTDTIATLTLIEIDSGTSIQITSPMGSADLKGCHAVQNIGAVETYQRRYLWVALMEIVEHDAVDQGPPAEKKAAKPSKHSADLKAINTREELVSLYKSLPEAARLELKEEFSARRAELEAA